MQVVHKTIPTRSRRICSVPQCSNYCTKDISLHSFPKDPKLCKKWKDILRIGKPISKFMNVCSQHFLKSDFMPENVFAPLTILKRLKKGVVPSQKIPVRQHDRPPRMQRGDRKWLKRHDTEIKSVNEENRVYVTGSVEDKEPPEIYAEPVLDVIPSTSSSSTFTSRGIPRNLPSLLTTFAEDKLTQTDSCESFHLSLLLNTDEKLKYFTGINHGILQSYLQCVENVAKLNGFTTENLENCLILVLCKIKTNMSFSCLSVLFGISLATCTRIFYAYVTLLATSIKPAIYWPTKGEILQNMPRCFEKFKATRIVLDATEIKVQKLNCLKCRILSYSHYKCCHTMKFLIGITPSGLISYVSKGYGGRASDKAIFCLENLIKSFDPYDAIMVDKGVLIEKECNEHLVTLIQPPFLRQQKQFSKEDAIITANIARARVHVERAIQRIKTFSILKDQIDWYIIPYIEDIMTIVAATVNMSPPIFADDKF